MQTLATKKELGKYWNNLGNNWTESSIRQQNHKAICIFPNFSMFNKNLFKKLWNFNLCLIIDALTDSNIEYKYVFRPGLPHGAMQIVQCITPRDATDSIIYEKPNSRLILLTLEWNSKNNDSVRKIQTWRKEE